MRLLTGQSRLFEAVFSFAVSYVSNPPFYTTDNVPFSEEKSNTLTRAESFCKIKKTEAGASKMTEDAMKTIEECRLEIEKLDSKIVDLLVRRVFTTNEMAEAKKKQGLPIYDQMREDLLRRRIRQLAGTEYEDVISRIYETIITESKKQQMQRFFE